MALKTVHCRNNLINILPNWGNEFNNSTRLNESLGPYNIQNIYLNNNHLQTLPDSFNTLEYLNHIEIKDNLFTGIPHNYPQSLQLYSIMIENKNK